jgi:hypothetical protein
VEFDLDFCFSYSVGSFCILFIGDVVPWFFSRVLLATLLPIVTLRSAGIMARRRLSNESGWALIGWSEGGGKWISDGAVSTGEVGL